MAPKKKIKLTECDHDEVKKQLLALSLDAEGSLKKCVDRMAAYYAEHEGDAGLEIADCDVCNGESDAALDACPYCGEGGVMDEGVPVKAPAKAETQSELPLDNAPPPPKPRPKTAPKCVACDGTGKSSKGAACGPCKGTGKKGGKAPAKTPAKTTQAKAPAKAPAKKAATKKAPAKKVPARKSKKAAPKVDKSAEPTVVSTTIVTVKMLDEQIDIIKVSVQAGAMAMHTIGSAFKEIRDSASWKMRMTKGDVSRYGNFGQFCVEELGATKQHVYRAIAVAEQFTAKQVAGLSGNQIRAIQMLSKDAQGDALKAAKNGEGTSALSNRASNLKGDKAPEAPIPTKAVTVAMAMGIQKVPMYKRPTKGAKVADTENATPAQSMADKPWLAIELSNKVRLIVRIDADKHGNLQATVEHRRGEQVI